MFINGNSTMFKCKNETYAQSILSNSFFLFPYLSKNVDHFNYSFPIQNEVRSESFSLSTNTTTNFQNQNMILIKDLYLNH